MVITHKFSLWCKGFMAVQEGERMVDHECANAQARPQRGA